MTLTPPDPDPLDDDALAIDAVAEGTATGAQRRRVAADAALQARVDELLALRDALAEPVTPLPPSTSDDMIKAALATASLGGPAQQRPTSTTADLHASPTPPNRTRWLVAAAIVVLLALGTATLPRLTAARNDRSDNASSAAVSSTTMPSAVSGGGAPGTPETPGPPEPALRDSSSGEDSFAGIAIVRLDDMTTLEELVARSLARLDNPPADTPKPATDVEATDDAAARTCLSALASRDGVELVAAGAVDGVDHLVVVTGTDTGARLVRVIRIADCTVVDQFVP